jgi:hypothetical protein
MRRAGPAGPALLISETPQVVPCPLGLFLYDIGQGLRNKGAALRVKRNGDVALDVDGYPRIIENVHIGTWTLGQGLALFDEFFYDHLDDFIDISNRLSFG